MFFYIIQFIHVLHYWLSCYWTFLTLKEMIILKTYVLTVEKRCINRKKSGRKISSLVGGLQY